MNLKAILKYGTFSLVCVFACVAQAFGQFSSSVQGTVQDGSGAVIPKATVTLTNEGTLVVAHADSNSQGVYRFVSLPPGTYAVSASVTGFTPSKTEFTLATDENRNVDLKLVAGGANVKIEVTTEAPLLDTSDSRNEQTFDTKALADLPLNARNPTSLVILAPGVTGRGEQGAYVFNSENYVDASANGQGQNGNQFIVDGLDVTSTIRPGVLNLTPNADAIDQVSVQVNTYTVDYGRAGSIQTVMTTKSGTDQFHGLASEYYTYQAWQARGEFGTPQPQKVLPYHTNNMSFALGGPVKPIKQFFFFAGYEPYLSLQSNGGGTVFFESPEFVSFAQSAMPNSPEIALLTKYPASNVTGATTSTYAGQKYGTGACATGSSATGNLGPAYDNLPCNLPLFDSGNFSSSTYNNAYQFNVRLDKYFNNDRVYGQFFRDHISSGTPAVRPSSVSTNLYYTDSLQLNETHTFSPSTLNEASFGYNKIDGHLNATGDFSIPTVNVAGLGTGWGAGGGFADGEYFQHSYHWRDVLDHIVGAHSLKAGFEAWRSDDIANFGPTGEQPNFFFTDMIQLINNNPLSEGGLTYDPITGKPKLDNYGYAETTFGFFAEDTWKASHRLTVNYGLRYDNFGNPYASVSGTALANFIPASGSTFAQTIAAGGLVNQSNVFKHDLNWVFSPRGGVAYDLTGNGKWVVRGGVGLFHNQFTLGNAENGLRNNPPGFAYPTFLNNGTTSAPIFAFGTSNTPPFGFPYPTVPTGPSLDSKGGRVGANFAASGVDVRLSSPDTENWSASIERGLGLNLTASVGYSGSHSSGLVGNGGSLNTSYGMDVNLAPGSEAQNPIFGSNGVWTGTGNYTRPNTSFGSITYAFNNARANYNALIVAVKGRFSKQGFLTASYTRSESKDSEEFYPDPQITSGGQKYDLNQYYSKSPWDVPNRFSLGWSYDIPGISRGNSFARRLTDGFNISGSTVLQSGNPFNVYVGNALMLVDTAGTTVTATNYQAELAAGHIGFGPHSGDYGLDGQNNNIPDVVAYGQKTDRKSYKYTGQVDTGIIKASQFANPAFKAGGTLGNEKLSSFRNPGYADTDLVVKKLTPITERFKLELRGEFFNAFNRVNLNGIDSNYNDAGTPGFGTTASNGPARVVDVAAKLIF